MFIFILHNASLKCTYKSTYVWHHQNCTIHNLSSHIHIYFVLTRTVDLTQNKQLYAFPFCFLQETSSFIRRGLWRVTALAVLASPLWCNSAFQLDVQLSTCPLEERSLLVVPLLLHLSPRALSLLRGLTRGHLPLQTSLFCF